MDTEPKEGESRNPDAIPEGKKSDHALASPFHIVGDRETRRGYLFRVESVQDLTGGFLHACQSLRAEGPELTPEAWLALPDRMSRLSFRGVQRSTGGLLDCHFEVDRVDCRLLGRWPALSCSRPQVSFSPRSAVIEWRVEPGLLARPGESDYGTLNLGAEVVGKRDDTILWRLWSEVKGYPSRFLTPSVPAWRWPREKVAALYGACHYTVTSRYLRALAAYLERGED